MKIIDSFKNMLARRGLKSQINNQRPRRITNLPQANSVGIIYREKGESFYILVKQYVKYLRSEHGVREVMALAYVDNEKFLPHYHQHKLHYDYFTPKDLNFRLLPEADHLRNFIQKPFDILIDFEQEECLPLRAVLAQSYAALKVGVFQDGHEPFYDLMLAKKEGHTFDDFIAQLNHYLTVINTQHART